MIRLLIVDEAEAVRQQAAALLSDFGFVTEQAESALAALALCNATLPRAVIVDGNLHGALELIGNIRAMPQGRSVRILYAVDQADLRRLMAAKTAGADDFLLKPFDRKGLGQAFSGLSAAA